MGDDVKPGQVWADNDPRSHGRQVRVERVDDRYAYVRGRDSRGGWDGRPSRIRRSAMRPGSKGQRTGYPLVEW